jgi:Ca2+-binding EF-hand superfamily protein
MSFSEKVLDEMNKFRTRPKSIEQILQTFKLGLSRLRARDPFINEIEAFISTLGVLKPMPPLQLNEELSKAALSQIELFSRDEEHYQNYRIGKDLKGIIPEHYLPQECALVAESADNPNNITIRVLLNKQDKFKVGRSFFTNPAYTQIGIADVKNEQDCYVILIFAQHEAKQKKEVSLPKGNLSELKQAFDFFDVNKIGEINPKDTVDAMEVLGFQKRNPKLLDIMKELYSEYNDEYVDWPNFADFIMKKISDKSSNEGLRIIFDLYVDDKEDDTISLMHLKKIVEDLEEEKAIQQVKKLLLMKGASNAKLNFEEFVDYMKKTYTQEEIDEKVKMVKDLKKSEDEGKRKKK